MPATMTLALACRQLRSALAPLGFAQYKPNVLWARTDEVLQVVRLDKVRKMAGAIEVGIELWSPFGASVSDTGAALPPVLVRESIGDSRFTPAIWTLARFSPADVAWRVSRIGAAFTRAADIARHYSDRYQEEWVREALTNQVDLAQLEAFAAPSASYAFVTNAPNDADTLASLGLLAEGLFQEGWTRHADLDGHWTSDLEQGGYRYCAYLTPNSTGTLASIHFYAATSADIQTAASYSSKLSMARASKFAVLSGELALHLPLCDVQPALLDTARRLINDAIKAFPPNAIRPPASENTD